MAHRVAQTDSSRKIATKLTAVLMLDPLILYKRGHIIPARISVELSLLYYERLYHIEHRIIAI